MKNKAITLRTKLTLLGYGLSLLLVVGGMYWFRFVWLSDHSVKAYIATAASFSASQHLGELNFNARRDKILVVHFIDEGCPCSRYSLPYIERLQAEFHDASHHVRVEAAAPASRLAQEIKNLVAILPASPATAIWDRHGQLVYFGPYSTGAYCGDGEDLVRYILNQLRRGNAVQWIDQEAQGCMCAWPNR